MKRGQTNARRRIASGRFGDGGHGRTCEQTFGDGRVDLAVAQSNEETRLLHNLRAKPGLRVKLEGTTGNPHGVGSVIRAKTASGLGRAQVVTAGSGYWSQDSAVLVVTSGSPIIGIQVRWPDGTITEQAVATETKSVTISQKK